MEYLCHYRILVIYTDTPLADSIPAKKIFPKIPSEKNDIPDQKISVEKIVMINRLLRTFVALWFF